ncbi:MAG: hypothetical protein NTZ80_02710, partial [Patescibacteria group bacterium]|nr:hypothetical protein [Patescibacteria group bacterium]
MKKSVTLKRIMMVVYKTNRNTWRGFCAPFDVSGEFRTEKGAKDGLIEMVEIYMNGLKEFSYPNHLVNKRLSNPEDVVVHEKLKKV